MDATQQTEGKDNPQTGLGLWYQHRSIRGDIISFLSERRKIDWYNQDIFCSRVRAVKWQQPVLIM